jgi:hypothetical protein
MKLITFTAAGLLAFVLLLMWLVTQIRYRISSRHLRVTLFGLTVRKIELTDIKRISKRMPSRLLCEKWMNTFKPKHRVLAIKRHSGILKYFLITPRNRYIFLADLQNAIHRVKPNLKTEDLVEDAPEDEAEEQTQTSTKH